jgi:vacuolar-type H+-ATPase subunit E/Vma4
MGFPHKTLWRIGQIAFSWPASRTKVAIAIQVAYGMSRLELAQKRLAKALEGLEKAAELAGQRGKAEAGAAARTAALIREREQLLERIAQLEDELAALSSATQEVKGRLDGAIGEIRAALAR